MSVTPPESTRDAIELMTAWTARPDGPPDLLMQCIGRHVDDRPAELGLVAALEVLMGMTTLCGALLLLLEHETGRSPEETLRLLALHYAEDEVGDSLDSPP